jgi:hypothetical protein
MSFQDAAAILTSLAAQATGETGLAVQNLSDYISVGQKALRTGYDPLNIGISQLVSKTIFAYRPYTGALSILDRDSVEWGAITRKVNAIKQPVESSGVYALTDGQHSPDMFDVRKPKLWQSNFFGFDVWADHVSVTRQQLKNAVQNPADMGRLLDLVLGTKANEMELSRESFRRATLANMIGAINAMNNAPQIRHLLAEYNAATGLTLTATTVKQPANYEGFIRWAYAEIAKVSDRMTSMNAVYHLNPTEGTILRHTPKEMQRLYIYSGALHEVDANVLATTFNAARVENQLPPITASVDFFQSFNTPDAVNVTPAYIGADGAVVEATAQNVTNIFALLADRDALGVNFYDQSVDVSPYEAAGKYYNYWYHDAHRYYNDVTENAVLFLMD